MPFGMPRTCTPGWPLIGAIVFGLVAAVTFGPIWRAGASSVVPTHATDAPWMYITRADATFEAWQVSRHAHTLLNNPLRLFDTEHCAPWENTLTLGVPMVTMGILAMPVHMATGDPIATYNIVLVLLCLISAAAMYVLVTDWTRAPAAGIVAGLLFGFHAIRLGHIVHPAEWDVAWTAFGLFFARRLLANGRWRDAFGLGLVVTLQVWASFYALLTAAFVTLPFAVWLVVHYGLRKVRPAQLAAVVVVVAVASIILFAPYLQAQGGSSFLRRSESEMRFAAWSDYLPSGPFFLGCLLPALAAVALICGRERAVKGLDGDPRWALLGGAILVQVIAAGPFNHEILAPLLSDVSRAPNLYRLVAGVLPGLDTIRVVARLSAGVHLVACVLAGMGAAALIGLARRYGTLVGAVLVGVAAFDVAGPPLLRIEPTYTWQLHPAAASEASIEFYRALEALGDTGPLLELPVDREAGGIAFAPSRILLSFYHHRRTSACYGSYYDRGDRGRIVGLAERLPGADAVDQLRGMGFRTVVVDQPVVDQALRQRIDAAGRDGSDQLPVLHRNGSMAAYSLGPVQHEPRASD